VSRGPAYLQAATRALLPLVLSGIQACEGNRDCLEPASHEGYCIPSGGSPSSCDFSPSTCDEGAYRCSPGLEHPPAGEGFLEWAWRCEELECDPQRFLLGPGPDWQEERPYVPPDPASLTGEWVLWTGSQSIVPLGCAPQASSYAEVQSLAVNPVNPDVLYVGLAMNLTSVRSHAAGVYKSVDGGRTWFTAWAGIGRLDAFGQDTCYECELAPTVNALYVDPAAPQVLFASTDERGLFWSRDGGAHWTELQYLDGHTRNPGSTRRGMNGTLYHSAGASFFRWNEAEAGFEFVQVVSQDRSILALVPDPVLADRVWLGMGTIDRTSDEAPILVSDDAGSTWREIGHDLLGADALGQNVASLAICPADPRRIAAAVYKGGIYLSTDGGESWDKPGPSAEGVEGWYVGYAPYADRCVLYAMIRDESLHPGKWRTEDDGATWTREVVPPLRNIAFNAFLPEMIFGISPWAGTSPFELWIRR